jgi:hypothetical protein
MITNFWDTTLDSQDFAIARGVGGGSGEIVEGAIGDADDVIADEDCAFGSALFRMLDAALPLDDGPSGIVVLRHFAEDLLEIDLAVSQRAEASGTVDPIEVAAVDAGAAA